MMKMKRFLHYLMVTGIVTALVCTGAIAQEDKASATSDPGASTASAPVTTRE